MLDLWFEKVVKPRLKGEAYLVRYIDDFVVCFQYRSDAKRFQEVLIKRLDKFALAIEPNKTRLVEFGRFAQRDAKKWNRKVETIYFLGFTSKLKPKQLIKYFVAITHIMDLEGIIDRYGRFIV